MSHYYQRSLRALQLAGMSEGTRKRYARAVRQLVEFTGKSPDRITETELEDYFLHRENIDKWAGSTMRISQCGIRFFFENVLERKWQIFKYLSTQRERKLPCILSKEEVFRVLKNVNTSRNYAYFSMVYACGLRLSEGLNLQVSDIDSDRMMVHVHRGKGAKDRYVPLPGDILVLLRRHWLSHRNPQFLFPSRGRRGNESPTAERPMTVGSVQNAFRKARVAAGIKKRRVTIHTLRHCYATHLLEAGTSPRVIQCYMGHSRLETTMAYFHLTRKGTEDAYAIIDNFMKGF